MKTLLSCALVALFAAVSVPAMAAGNAQQDKMKSCNTQAAGKKGDERKAFMKDCLSAKPAKPDNSNKMAACNTKSKGMKGDERKKFMSDCMKGSA
jgi:hypothetical protein